MGNIPTVDNKTQIDEVVEKIPTHTTPVDDGTRTAYLPTILKDTKSRHVEYSGWLIDIHNCGTHFIGILTIPSGVSADFSSMPIEFVNVNINNINSHVWVYGMTVFDIVLPQTTEETEAVALMGATFKTPDYILSECKRYIDLIMNAI